MSVNARGIMICNRAVTGVMVKQSPSVKHTRSGPRDIGKGAIVNLGSAVSHIAQPGKTAYVTSKHAVLGITKSAGKSEANQAK